MKILAVIPARSGSKGIRKKNIKLLNNKPLISYIINTAKKSKYVTDVVVTSNSNKILNIVEKYGVKTRERPKHLAEDHVPLDPVICDTYLWYRNNFSDVDYVITLQPTSPLLSSNTLDHAIEYTINNNFDTVLSVIDNTHLGWKKENNKIVPDYIERLNRQWLPKKYKETGAFFISKKEYISENNRFGERISVYEVPSEEAIDIDTPLDWYLTEKLLQRLKVLFVTSGNSKIGMGHIYRTMTLADSLIGNQIDFFLLDSSKYAKEIIKNNGYEYKDGNIVDVYEMAKNFDIVINDFLDTPNDYMKKLKELNRFIVNFEDLSVSSDKSNLVFNALYERFNVPKNHRYGYKYCVLKEEFLIEYPNSFKDKFKNILITFGGVDLNNLTLKTINSIRDIVFGENLKVKIILGPGYTKIESLLSTVEDFEMKSHVKILQNISNMAEEMKNIDLAITSNGRTVYELASMRIPIVSIAQNDRETLHTFARYNEGVEYLGIACNIKEEDINKKVLEIINNREKRLYMYKNLPYKELRNGIMRVKGEIIDNYWRWKNDKNW